MKKFSILLLIILLFYTACLTNEASIEKTNESINLSGIFNLVSETTFEVVMEIPFPTSYEGKRLVIHILEGDRTPGGNGKRDQKG
jgi:thioredoxin-related protein